VVSVTENDIELREKISQIFNENEMTQEQYIKNIKFKDAHSLK
jgi:hypothetical protein